ncbi:DUF7673 family protein [Marinobacter sp. DS40M6]|uniref:DUF7673 family protein n=1 Tax=Marinobacter sp. DS40M6 TaxID=1597776 RepID=UPI00235A218E|nr:hypothetical protein [Marinobacter sp. DS40M6]MDC8456899.1 hypothetical protein [Marinobacter sp. DS40M6]
METIQDPIYEGNVTVRCTLEELQAIEDKKRQRAAARYQNNPQADATKLYQIARGDTGGGRAASALLLSLWNNNFVCNMRDVICSIDIDNSEAVIALLGTLGPGHHLERYLTQEQIIEIIDVWGSTHERSRK